MKMRLITGIIMLASINTNLIAQFKNESKQLDQFIEKGKEDWNIPGLSITVVKAGEVMFKKSYGVKDIETNEAVSNNTLFSLASTTKGFISLSLGMLVDDKKLEWNDKVRKHLPEFKLSDPYLTEDIRVRDLLTHSMGFPQTDYLWSMDSISSKELIKRFGEVETVYPARGGFAYQNVMYVVAGEVIEAISGMHWTEFVNKRILKPLEMTRTTTLATSIKKMGDYVTPHHQTLEGQLETTEYTFSDNVGALGMMWSNIDDLSNYLIFLVNEGVYKSDTLISSRNFKEIFTPQTIIPNNSRWFPKYQKLTNPNWFTYSFGWVQQDYRGKKLDFHPGSFAGLVAMVGVMHEEDLAVYFTGNLDHAEFRHAVLYKVMDLYAFQDNSKDWNSQFLSIYQSQNQRRKQWSDRFNSQRIPDTTPEFPLSEYEGTYKNEKFGTLKLTVTDDKILVKMNDYIDFELSHWHLNTFKVSMFQGLVYFQKGPDGKISNLVGLGEQFKKMQ